MVTCNTVNDTMNNYNRQENVLLHDTLIIERINKTLDFLFLFRSIYTEVSVHTLDSCVALFVFEYRALETRLM